MTTSTYPDGSSRWCPVCGNLVTVWPSSHGDAPCPRCGNLLWFAAGTERTILADLGGLRDGLKRVPRWATWCVDWSGRSVPSDALRLLGELDHVSELVLDDADVDAAALANLGALSSLEVLELGHTGVDDAWMPVIGGLGRLEVLGLFETAVTDSGLSHLAALDRLWCLDLEQTAVSESGLQHLTNLAGQLEWLFLSGTDVSNAAVPLLGRFRRLEKLWLLDTRMTRGAVECVRGSLPGCRVAWTPRGDG